MNRLWKPTVVAAVAAGAALAIMASAIAAPVRIEPAPRMSAPDLANGILFNQGPAARYLTALQRPELVMNLQSFQAEHYVDRALRTDPGLARALVGQLQSGNRIQVQAAMQVLAKLGLAAADHVYGTAATNRAIAEAKAAVTHAAPKSEGTVPDSDVQTDIEYYYYYIYYYYYAAAAAIAIVLLFAATPGSSTGQLAAEQAVSVVATHLRTA